MRPWYALWIGAFMALAAGADDPLDVGTSKQLFIDHRFIAASENVTLRIHPAQKIGIIHDENGNRIKGHIARVIDHNGKIRIYVGADGTTAYDSDDGLAFRNSGESLSGGTFTTLFVDDHASDPAKRYKVFWIKLSTPPDAAVDGVYAGYSADAVNITPVGRVFPYYVDNPVLCFWDARIAKYVVFTRSFEQPTENQRRIARIEMDDPLQPWPYTPTDDDHWWASPRNVEVVLQQDESVEPFSDIYYNAATLYPYAQDVYLFFTAQFRHFAPSRQPFVRPRVEGQWEDFGLLEVQLAVSRDGIQWDRPSREPYVAPGLVDEWDRWYTVMGPGMVRRGSYLYQYYYSSGMTHDSTYVRPEYAEIETELGGIGFVKQRLDGFVSASADHHGGWLQTPPLVFTGSRLRLNVDSGSMGTALVEIQNPDGSPIDGYSLNACEEVGGNYIDQTVYWNGNPDLTPLAGRPVVLRFRLTRADLYAFQFTAE